MPTKFDRALGILNPKPVNEGFEKPQILTNDNISGVNSNNNEDGSAGEKSIRNETSDFVLYNKEKPDAGVYEYIYEKTAPRVPEPDPAKEKQTQRMAGFADLAMLLSDGITVTAGGIVNKRNTTATGVNNRSAEAIRERYRQQKEKYDAGLLAAKYNDLQDKRKREDYLEKLRQDRMVRDERYQQDRDLIKERERANINLYREQNKMREDLERTKGDIRIGVAAAKPGAKAKAKGEEEVSYRPELDIYDQYSILQSLYQGQVREYEEAKKKNKKAVSSQYITIAEPKATTKGEIEAYVGMHRRHIKPILDQMQAEAEAKAKAEAKNNTDTDPLGLGIKTTNNNPLDLDL